MTKDTIICDLDGTLCDCEHRRHHVTGSPKNWDEFYAGVKDDTPNEPMRQTLLALKHTFTNIIFVSGRPERCREDTVNWLYSWLGMTDAEYQLFMRGDTDRRQDYIVKREILTKHIDKERVLMCFDDRDQVVDMWREEGLTCFQVAPGDF